MDIDTELTNCTKECRKLTVSSLQLSDKYVLFFHILKNWNVKQKLKQNLSSLEKIHPWNGTVFVKKNICEKFQCGCGVDRAGDGSQIKN